jgi:hypothetical protein
MLRDQLVWWPHLSDGLGQQAGTGQRMEVGLERTVLAVESEPDSVAIGNHPQRGRVQVGTVDHER